MGVAFNFQEVRNFFHATLEVLLEVLKRNPKHVVSPAHIPPRQEMMPDLSSLCSPYSRTARSTTWMNEYATPRNHLGSLALTGKDCVFELFHGDVARFLRHARASLVKRFTVQVERPHGRSSPIHRSREGSDKMRQTRRAGGAPRKCSALPSEWSPTARGT